MVCLFIMMVGPPLSGNDVCLGGWRWGAGSDLSGKPDPSQLAYSF